MIRFNGMNMNNPVIDMNFQQIYQICSNNHVCENCPVYQQDGFHDNNNNITTICHKVAEKIINRGKNNG